MTETMSAKTESSLAEDTVEAELAHGGLSMLARYTKAAALGIDKIAGLMRNRVIEPQWTGEGDQFWYKRQTDDAEEYVLVDPAAGQRVLCDAPPASPAQRPSSTRPGVLLSPDGVRGAFVRDHNLWLWDVSSGAELQLTYDGEEAFAWGVLPENSNMNLPFKRMGLLLPPVGTVFSPSGTKLLTIRADERALRARVMVENVPASGARPVSHEIRVQLDDEGAPAAPECLVVDVVTGARQPIDVSDGLASSLMSNGSSEVTWSTDESRLYMLNHRSGAKSASLVEVDVATGERRDKIRVEEEPLYEPNQFLYSLPLVRVLPDTDEVILFSQQDGWGHLYRYDLSSGKVRNRITSGELVVRDILRVDPERREVTFVAGSCENGHNPYWRKLFRASLDGTHQELLTPEPADHELPAPEPQFFQLVVGQGKKPVSGISPSGRYFVDHMSTVSEPPVILLRDSHQAGAVIVELERTDVSRLEQQGYRPPQPFRVTADDGKTSLWGVISLPSDPVDPHSIPVIDHMYAGFQTTWSPPSYVGGGKTTGAHAALPAYNALGVATVMLDGRGTPGRDRQFRQWTHGHTQTPRGLEDHVWAIQALKDVYPVLDMNRVGVIGHSYGGYNAARSMLLFPEFFKVGVSGAGVHDPRKMPYGMWSWFLGADHARDTDEYMALGNVQMADHLAGKLLIACGELDENATVDHTYALVDALIRAGKRFDMKIWPGLNHYQQGPYVQMAFWDHFVTHLMGVSPPAEYAPPPS